MNIGSGGEITWDDRVDICPDTVYLRLTGKTPDALQVATALSRHAEVMLTNDRDLGGLAGLEVLRVRASNSGLPQSARRPKTIVVVAVIGLIVVAVRRAQVVRLIVERPGTQHPASRPSPFGKRL